MKSHIYREPIVGILGGMGPAATNYLFGQIIANTIVGKDQDHLHVVINNYPHIPDRTESILGRGNDTFPFLLEGLTLLNNANVDYVLIPCNTAHYFLPKLRKYTNAVIVDMIKLTINYIKLNHPKLRKIGLLATDGVIKTRIYEKYCQSNDLKILTCGKNAQKELMDIIYGINGIKRGFISFELRSRLNIVMNQLIERGAEIIVLGCTELPLLLTDIKYSNVQIIDPIKLLARYTVETCGKKVKIDI